VRRAEVELDRRSPHATSDAELADLAQLRESTVHVLRTAADVTAALHQRVDNSVQSLE
jgi:hypothetical protein